MKTILLFSIFNALFGVQDMKYKNVIIRQNGSDNFNFDTQTVTNDTGRIFLIGSLLVIEDKHYLLKSTRHRRRFRSGNASITFSYKQGNLSSVHLRRCNTTYCYTANSN